MKKLLAVLMALLMVLCLAGCGETEEVVEEVAEEELVETLPEAKDNYESYMAAEMDSEIEVYASVQDHQAWWSDDGVGKVTIYAQDDDGAYFIYEANVEEEVANAMVPGSLIKVTGYKSEWSGEVELVDATAELIVGGYDGKIYDAKDVTEYIGTDELINYMNQKVTMNGLTVKEVSKKDSEWDPDLYITAELNGNEVSLCVENYLTDPETEVYKTGEALNAGDVIDVTAYLYWYNGANPHVTSITVK